MKKLALFFLMVLLTGPSSVTAGDFITTKVSAGAGALFGHTTYQIGKWVTDATGTAAINFPYSELKFPLNLYTGQVRAEIGLANRFYGVFRAEQNLNDDPGQLEDSDWLNTPSTLNIYSESDLSAEARILSGLVRYRLYRLSLNDFSAAFSPQQTWTIYTGLGYLHQNFDFTADNTYEIYPASGATPAFEPGPTITYEVTYRIPYLELACRFKNGPKAETLISLGYSPDARLEDTDHHLLRNLKAEGEADGEAFLFSANFQYAWTRYWFTSLDLTYRLIKTKGKSLTYLNNAWDHTLYQENESKQTRVMLQTGLQF